MDMTASFSSRKTPVSLWPTVASYARLLFRADTPWTVKGILVLAILYFLAPFDLVPDWIVGLGVLDDLAFVALLVGWAIHLAGRLPKISPEKQK
jgi:uncharacterized membrane protein YkvA (DUF1232 family)